MANLTDKQMMHVRKHAPKERTAVMQNALTFERYQKQAQRYAVYPELGFQMVYPSLGATGEASELLERLIAGIGISIKIGRICEHTKKVARDKAGCFEPADTALLVKEMGDVLWYLQELSAALGITFEDVALLNLAKLKDREKRDVLGGSGDER